MNKLTIILMVTFMLVLTDLSAQLKVRSDQFIQIGYNRSNSSNNTLSFGKETNSPNNGKYGIEYWKPWGTVGGLNFYRPWPAQGGGGSNFTLWLGDDKKVAIGGIGMSNYKLTVYGSAYCTGSWVGSDRKLKKKIEPINGSLDKIMQLQPKSYIYDFSIDKYSDKMNIEDYDEVKQNTIKDDLKIEFKSDEMLGFIADELEEVFPQLVQTDEEGFAAINYDGLLPVLVDAIQMQQKKIETLENALKDLKSNNSNYRLKNSSSESKSSSGLYNNQPNPFNSFTKIQYYFDKNDLGLDAIIDIYDQTGTRVKSVPLSKTSGKGEISISKDDIGKGIFIYSLSIGGKVIDSKTMICVQ